MIGTEFLQGQGLGNQLMCYVSARCIAMELGYEFGTAGQEQMAVNIHSKRGMYFMDMDLGKKIDNPKDYTAYHEAEQRLFVPTCVHDMVHGCYVADADPAIYDISDHTLLYGNLQSEKYFEKYRVQIKEWLKVKEEYDDHTYTRDNLCIINVRGGEYTDNHELFLNAGYYKKAMKHMKKIRPDMEFMIVTDDVSAANGILPGIEAHHFDLAGDYVTIKNAKYLILSNSSFAFFPAYTSDTAEVIIAPKYWARHNVSNGYWASLQNIYSIFTYMDRRGRLFSAAQCLAEWEQIAPRFEKRFRADRKEYGHFYIKIRALADSLCNMTKKIERKLTRIIMQRR